MTTTPTHEKTFPSDEAVKLPRPFILRRLHSLLGLWIVIYLCEHLLVNSQAALFFHDEGASFVRMVSKIHDLPFLPVIEILFLGVPFFIHGAWGIAYALSGKLNEHPTDGSKPALPQYKRNHAYSWQRITSWILLVGIVAHVIHMRFVEYPEKIYEGDDVYYVLPVKKGRGLQSVAEKLDVTLSDRQTVGEKEIKLKQTEVVAVAPNAGAAFFLIVREAFTNPLLVVLYSILVIAATFHAFNGVWTFLITWGVTLTRRSQLTMRRFTNVLMGIVTLLGLMAAWGTYLTTLWQ